MAMHRFLETNVYEDKRVATDVLQRRMRAAVENDDAVDAIKEIIVNLIGSEEFAVYAVDDAGSVLNLVCSCGSGEVAQPAIPLGVGPVGRAALIDRVSITGIPPELWSAEQSDLTACIPLKIDGTLTGAIAIFRLLPQKRSAGALDRDLLTLLGSLAAPALHEAGVLERTGKRDA
jgi:hypothetical protein